MSYLSKFFDDQILQLLKNGGLGFMPSDTIYGLSARALDEQAVSRVHRLKDRDEDKPFIVLISDTAQLDGLGIGEDQVESVKKYWPGALTIIFGSDEIPNWLSRSTNSLAVRLPADDKLQQLIRRTGPLISTSANPQGQQPAASLQEAKKYFGDQLDFYVDGGELSNRRPSTIVKLVNGKLQVIRRGTVNL